MDETFDEDEETLDLNDGAYNVLIPLDPRILGTILLALTIIFIFFLNHLAKKNRRKKLA